MDLNMDFYKRDMILYGEPYIKEKYYGGTRSFEKLDLGNLRKLFNEKFIDPDECTCYSPEAQYFYEFMQDNPNFTCHGYAVSEKRGGGVVIEGLELEGKYSRKLMLDFIDEFRRADDFYIGDDYLYCWYD